MLTFLAQYASLLLIVALAFSVLALRNTIRAFNQSRHAPYYILREEAAHAAGRWALLSVAGIAATIAVAIFASRAPAASTEPTATPTATQPIATLGPAPTRTTTPTRTPDLTPTATPTLTPTATLAADIPDVLLTPIPGAVPPDAAAHFEFLTLATKIDANLNPIDPGLQFPTGTSRVYLFFRADSVNDGAVWGVFCYRDGAIVDSFVGLWEDGLKLQTSRAFCALDGQAGAYLLRAYLGATPAIEVQFSLAGAPASTQPPTLETSPTTTP